MSRLCWVCAKRHHSDYLPVPDDGGLGMDEDEHDAFVHIFMLATPGIKSLHPDEASFAAEIAALATAIGRYGGCVAAKARAKSRRVN